MVAGVKLNRLGLLANAGVGVETRVVADAIVHPRGLIDGGSARFAKSAQARAQRGKALVAPVHAQGALQPQVRFEEVCWPRIEPATQRRAAGMIHCSAPYV